MEFSLAGAFVGGELAGLLQIPVFGFGKRPVGSSALAAVC
jgi:hypothetical protein